MRKRYLYELENLVWFSLQGVGQLAANARQGAEPP